MARAAPPPPKEKLVMRLALLCLALAAPLSAEAASIAVTPPNQFVSVGGSFSVTLEASALGGAAIGGFDIDLGFDATRFSFVSAVFGGALGDPAVDQATDVVPGAGVVSLGSVSFLDPTELAALQTGTVSLVTLTFEAIATGAGAFTVEFVQLADAFGAELQVVNLTPATVDVVPEPALAWLLAVAAGAALARRRGWASAKNA
jgi:hypothetical protein